MPKATITKIYNWNGNKGATVTVEAQGKSMEVCAWASSPLFAEIKQGEEIEFSTEERENKSKPGEMQRWFTKINGQPEKEAKKQGGWGGGGGRQADEESIAAQVILKEASALANVEFMRSKAEQISPERILEISMGLTQAYLCAYRTIKKEKGGTA